MNTTLIALGAFALIVVAVIFAARKWGSNAAKREAAEDANKRAKEANEIDEDVSRLDESDLDRELRDRE